MIKKDLTEAPVLAMPNTEGHMVLVSDTSKIACGSALYQEQKGRYRLIAYSLRNYHFQHKGTVLVN